MNKMMTKIGAFIMSAVITFSFAPATITTLAAGSSSGQSVENVEKVPVYGLYNPNSGEHIFTIYENEASSLLRAGWNEGDIKWYAPTEGNPVYRVYNPNEPLGDHHYTTNSSEVETLLKAGWTEGNIVFYSASSAGANAVPIYGVYNPNAYATGKTGAHHLTQNKNEVDSLLSIGWKEGNPKFYGYPVSEGKVLNIQVWNEEFISRVANHYPGYTKMGPTSGKIGNVEVKFNITPTKDNAYQNNLDWRLPNNSSASADDKIDIFLIEADYALKYVDSDLAMKLSDLGITSSDLSDQYKYTQDIVTDKNGNIRASSWQAWSAGLIYNRAIAKAVLGSDDPAEVQKAVSDWSKYNETAAKMKAANYLMTATANDTFRVYSNNVSAPWVKDNKVTIDANIKKWVDDSKAQVDAKQTGTGDLWGDEWSAGFKAPGTVFCYFGPSWLFNYSMGNAYSSFKVNDGSIAYRGGWGFCEGPQSHYWGGTWVCAANGTDNPTLVKDMIRTMTTDKKILKEIAIEDKDCVNSKTVLKDLAGSSIGNNEILGGQNPYAILAASGEKIDMSNTCPYDQGCDEVFQSVMKDYFNGTLYSYDAAIAVFQNLIIEKYPNLTF